jgi:hypothetical protein
LRPSSTSWQPRQTALWVRLRLPDPLRASDIEALKQLIWPNWQVERAIEMFRFVKFCIRAL